MNNVDFAVIGGDRRMSLLAGMLGCRHYLYESDTLPEKIESTAAVLPVPCSLDGRTLNAAGATPLWEVISRIRSPFVFGGRIPADVREALTARGTRVYDLLEDEALLIKNAQLTAEGALGIIIAETQRSVCGASIAILGFGRIGRALARMLTALGASVTVAARSAAQLAEAECMGCRTASIAEPLAVFQGADAVCNTAPAKIADADALATLGGDAPFIELASGGYNADAARAANVRLINAQGLPGKTAPESAAQIIYDRITDLLLRQI